MEKERKIFDEDGLIRNSESESAIEKLFYLFSNAAMNPKAYKKKATMPASVTVPLGPKEMEILQLIASRIGATRASVAHVILKTGLVEAAAGCGFDVDEEGNIPEEQKTWDLTPKAMGFGFTSTSEEEAA